MSVRVFAVLLFTAVLLAQTKPAGLPKTIPASVASENTILKAQHDLDSVQAKEKDSNIQFMQLQQQAKALQDGYAGLQSQETAAKKAKDAAIENAWKESGLSKDQYVFDDTGFTFTEKKSAAASNLPPGAQVIQKHP